MNSPLDLFKANFKACLQRTVKLAQSLEKTRELLPLTVLSIQQMTDEQEESIDALILRYSQCVSIVQDHLFRGIALIEQEDISNKSNRDKALLMERIGAIQSADAFGTATILRNKFAHNYPEEAADRVERMNLIVLEANIVLKIFQDITFFVHSRGYLA